MEQKNSDDYQADISLPASTEKFNDPAEWSISQLISALVKRYEHAENTINALVDALAAIIECDDARDVFESFGLADSTDNDGQPYPSKHLADILDRARAALNGVSRYDNISENQGFKTPNVTEPEHDRLREALAKIGQLAAVASDGNWKDIILHIERIADGVTQPSTEVEKISTDTEVR